MFYPWNKSYHKSTNWYMYEGIFYRFNQCFLYTMMIDDFWENSFTFIILSSCSFDETVTRIKGPHHFWGFMCPLRDLGPCKVIMFLWNDYDNLYRVAKYIHRAKLSNLEKRVNCNNWAYKLNRTIKVEFYLQLTSKVHYVLSLLL